jgi:hypothetical protein
MANIASGGITFEFESSSEDVFQEIMDSITASNLFNYGGGDPDFRQSENALECSFSSRWTGEPCWGWVDQQMGDKATLSTAAKSALVKSTISGYAYEEGAEYAEQVEKESGVPKLSRSPDDFGQYADDDDDDE